MTIKNILICDACKKEVEKFVGSDEKQYLTINEANEIEEVELDLCVTCNDKILGFIKTLSND